MISHFKGLWPILLKVVLPAGITAAGTTLSLLDTEAFRQFCGLQ